MIKKTIYLLFILFVGCNNGSKYNKQLEPKINLQPNEISIIEIIEGKNKYQIKDSASIIDIIENMNCSKITYIKFGSKNRFIMYDKKKKILEQGFFEDNILKINGVVYTANKEIFKRYSLTSPAGDL